MQNKHTIQVGDIYCTQEPETGNYFAFQIIEDKEESLVYLLLDYFDDRPPTESDFPKMKPFIRQRWFWNDSIDLCHADANEFPTDAMRVGNMPPLVSKECRTYGGWPTGSDFVAEAEWLSLPEETRRRFKEGQKSVSEVVVAGTKVRRSRQWIDDELLSAMTDYVKELYELPVAYTFEAKKFYPQLIPFLESRHTARELDWDHHGQQVLDLSRTYLKEVSIDDEDMLVIKLPRSCRQLTFKGRIHPELKVEASEGGKRLMIQLDVDKQNGLIPNLDIPQLSGLVLLSIENLDLSQIPHHFPHLNCLRLVGKPGHVKNINALSLLNELEERLIIDDLFGFISEEFPEPKSWPKLKWLNLESVPEEAGKHIRKVFKGKVNTLIVRKLRKPEWLAENIDNPLRHWDGSEFVPKSKFKKAVTVYRDARRTALAAAEDYTKDKDSIRLQKQLEQISIEYVQAFNKLDGRTYWIETEEREDICAAFDVILNAVQELAGVEFEMNHSQIYEAMDMNRDW